MAQIEPITIMVGSEEKIGCSLMVYTYFFNSFNRMRGDILDKDDNVLFTSVVTAKTFEEVAEQLNLKLLH